RRTRLDPARRNRGLLPDRPRVAGRDPADGAEAVGGVPAQLRQSEDPDDRRGDGPGAHAGGARAVRCPPADARRRGRRRLAHGPRLPSSGQTPSLSGHVRGTVPWTCPKGTWVERDPLVWSLAAR